MFSSPTYNLWCLALLSLAFHIFYPFGHFSFHLLVIAVNVFCFILHVFPCHIFTTKSNWFSHCRFYKSLPPISKAYGTACLLFTVACQLGLYHPDDIALLYELVFSNFQVDVLTLFPEHCIPTLLRR